MHLKFASTANAEAGEVQIVLENGEYTIPHESFTALVEGTDTIEVTWEADDVIASLVGPAVISNASEARRIRELSELDPGAQ